jgi:hypothetical protein
MKTYGLKVALKHQIEEQGAIIKLNKQPTLIAEVVDMGEEAEKRFPQISRGTLVVSPFVASSTVDEICYVSAYDLIAHFDESTK